MTFARENIKDQQYLIKYGWNTIPEYEINVYTAIYIVIIIIIVLFLSPKLKLESRIKILYGWAKSQTNYE